MSCNMVDCLSVGSNGAAADDGGNANGTAPAKRAKLEAPADGGGLPPSLNYLTFTWNELNSHVQVSDPLFGQVYPCTAAALAARKYTGIFAGSVYEVMGESSLLPSRVHVVATVKFLVDAVPPVPADALVDIHKMVDRFYDLSTTDNNDDDNGATPPTSPLFSASAAAEVTPAGVECPVCFDSYPDASQFAACDACAETWCRNCDDDIREASNTNIKARCPSCTRCFHCGQAWSPCRCTF